MISEDPLVGQQLGNYRIDRLIGRGGMAAVYYGWDVNLERPVAIKVIDARYRRNRSYAQRFVQEARSVATWRHENIVQVYYAGEEDGLFFFAMEYVDGLDLDSLLAEYVVAEELMPHDDVLRIAQAVASALDYAHTKGVIHRDVKPANVIVANGGRVVLTDFGLAMDVEQGSLGEVFGSANYISPEQARRSADAVPQSDQYSLGIMLYEMLTGQVPFTDPSPTSVALQHIMNPPPYPCELNPNLSAQTETVLLQALSKTPEERFDTCTGFVEALALALAFASPAEGEEEVASDGRERVPAPSMSRLSVAERVALYRQAHGAEPASPEEPPQAAPADTMLGVQLDEYRLEALLGQGGMARIYRARDIRLKRQAAIKVIDAPRRHDPDYIARFEREAQAIAQLEHPHIVRLYRYGQAHDVLYMAMQYIEGQDLRSRFKTCQETGQLLPPSQAMQIIREVCQALDYAHSKGVIHRDIKPSNIMLDHKGHAILTDFGLALLTQTGTRGEAFGSPRYIAPEQAVSSAGAVPQSDLYAVGVIMYEMLTGALPFEAPDPLSMALMHVSEPPRPPREIRPGLSAAVEAVLLKTLAKDPAERYPSGEALVAALDAALAAGPSPVPRPPGTAPADANGAPAAGPIPAPAAADIASGAPSQRPLPPPPAAVATPPVRPPTPPAASARTTASVPKKRSPIPAIAAAVVLVAILATVGVLWGRDLWNLLPIAGRPSPTLTVTATRPVAAKASPTGIPSRQTMGTQPVPITTTPRPTPSNTPASPTATRTATPTPFTVTPSPTATMGPITYDLLLVRRAGESLFVLNTGSTAFPLRQLRLDQGKEELEGSEWGMATLQSGHCVAVWNGKGDPRPPENVDCEPDPSAERLTREGKEIFWDGDKEFPIYFDGSEVATCFPKDEDLCNVSIAVGEQPEVVRLFIPLIFVGK